MFGADLGIDLGTANILVFVKGKGIVIQEPSVVALNLDTKKICAIGEEARRMIGRTPGNILAIRPLHEGVIADYTITKEILEYFIAKAIGRRPLFKPRVVVCVPSGVTGVEERAVRDAIEARVAKKCLTISEPMAAAIGSGLNVAAPNGNMVVDVGGGTTDIAVISLGSEVVSQSLRVGGIHFEEAIIRHIKRVYNVSIGERTAEQIKIEICSAYPTQERKMEIRGRNLIDGLPCNIELTTSKVYPAIEEPVRSIIDAIKSVLEQTPPELAADIMNQGMVLTGGGALLDGLAQLISQETKVPVHIPDDPLTCVARGTGECLNMLDRLQDSSVLKIS